MNALASTCSINGNYELRVVQANRTVPVRLINFGKIIPIIITGTITIPSKYGRCT